MDLVIPVEEGKKTPSGHKVAVFWTETRHSNEWLQILRRTELVGVEITAIIELCSENHNDFQLLRLLHDNELKNDQPEKPHQCISPMLLPANVIVRGQPFPQVTNCISDVWIQYYGERKWWIWGRTSQDFPRTTESLFNETCSVGSRESPDSARLYILMLFCIDVLICLPSCLQVRTTHVCTLLFFLPSSI